MTVYLAIDLGSTSFKAAVFDELLRPLGRGSAPLSYGYPSESAVELAVDVVREAVREAARRALESAGVAPAAVGAIAVTSQAQTFLVSDARGRPKTPFISWQDGRGREAAPRLAASLTDFADHSSFGSLLPNLQLSLVRSLGDARPGLIVQGDRIESLPSRLVRELTGTLALDENLAAMTGFYSLRERRWWSRALDVCELRREQLPAVLPIGAVAGTTGPSASTYGLGQGIQVVLAGNDQTACAYGARLDARRELLIALGTAQVVYVCCPELPAPDGDLVRGLFPEGKYYQMAVDGCGGNCATWAASRIEGCSSIEHFFDLAAQAPSGAGGVSFRPNGAAGTGNWHGLTGHLTPSNRARAVLEALAERMARMVEQLRGDPARTGVLLAGGGLRARIWGEILSRRLGVAVQPAQADPLSGAARMASEVARPAAERAKVT